MVTTKLNLSMTEPQVRQIYAKQGDTGRVLDITLDQTPEDGTLRILRPDGVEVTSEAVTGGEVSESGETVTFESMTEADVTELTVGIEPVQDLSNGDPSPTNICPITGHDEVTVTRAGINLWDEEWEGGTINTSTGVKSDVGLNTNIRSTNFIPVLASAEYYFCRQNFAGNIFEYDNNKNFIRVVPSPATFTTTANTGFLRFYMGAAYGNTYNHDISINYPSTDRDYHAYQSNTYTTSLGQTVYGGTLDMVSGVLTVDRAMVSLSGSDLNIGSSQTKELNMWRLPLNNPYGTLASLYPSGISNKYVMRNSYNGVNNNNGSLGLNQTSGSQILIRDDSLTTAQEVIDAFNSTPLTFVYPLATPQTYTLTAQQIKTLVGTNNVWASSGDIVSITFTYGGLLSELPSEATEIVGKCYCDVEQNGVSSMPFTLNVKKNERES